MGTFITSLVSGLLKTFFTRKVVFSLIVVLADWAVKRTDNDLDNQVLKAVKEGLDSNGGEWADNLYDRVKAGS